jgi:hypothetical protein
MYIYLTRWAVLLKRWFVTGLCGYLTHSRLVPSGLLTGPIANNVACWQTQLQIMCPADRPHCKWCGLLTSPIANDVACWPAQLQMMWPADQPNCKWCGLLTCRIANDVACWPAQLKMMWPADQPNCKWCLLTSPVTNGFAWVLHWTHICMVPVFMLCWE